MSSQKDTKPLSASGSKGQQTLLSFFGKPSTSSSQPASSSPSSARPTSKPFKQPVKTPLGPRKSSNGLAGAVGSSAVKSSGGTSSNATNGTKKSKSTPATSEGDELMLADTDEEEEDVKPKVRSLPSLLFHPFRG
jgi:hypothetical protein